MSDIFTFRSVVMSSALTVGLGIVQSLVAQTPADPYVGPCAKQDWQFAESREAKHLTEKGLDDFGSGFSSCEVAVVPFLNNSHVVRLQTSVHVDYSWTATLFQTKTDGVRLISSMRGMATPHSLTEPDALQSLNFLLASETVQADKNTLEKVIALHLFIIDFHNGFALGRTETNERALDIPTKCKISVSKTPLHGSLDCPEGTWEYEFVTTGCKVQIASVKEAKR